jgi:RNA polymerase sigma factor (sigma-70 family)
MEDTFKVGIKRYICHAELVRLRKAKGLAQIECAKYLGMSATIYMAIEKLQRYPTESEAQTIADFLDGNVYELFPRWIMPIFGKKKVYKVVEISPLQLTSREVLSLADPRDITVDIKRTEITESLGDPLSSLRPREKQVLEKRFGLNQEMEMSRRQISEEFGTSTSRIAQIEAKAIKKMRHPGRSQKLKEFVTGWRNDNE